MSTENRPKVGVGICVVKNGKVLIGKRKDANGDSWCAPGGHLEFGEDPGEAAAREAFEETGVIVKNVQFVGFTNDILHDRAHHYITLQFRADWASGEPHCTEPDKFHDEWHWADWNHLPEPRYIGLLNFIKKGYTPFLSL